MKYKRSSGVEFGPVDYVKYAESFGAKGLRVTNQEELEAALKEGYETDGPVLMISQLTMQIMLNYLQICYQMLLN